MVHRTLKKQTRIANPIAASAAATVKINSVNTCPAKSFKCVEKATKFIFTANNINYIDMSITITFLRFKNIPKIPITNNKAATVK